MSINGGDFEGVCQCRQSHPLFINGAILLIGLLFKRSIFDLGFLAHLFKHHYQEG
jgi:hypothetical protein